MILILTFLQYGLMKNEIWSSEELMIFWTHHGTIIDFWKNIDPWLFNKFVLATAPTILHR